MRRLESILRNTQEGVRRKASDPPQIDVPVVTTRRSISSDHRSHMVAFLLSVLAASEVSFNAPSSSRIYESRISSPRPTGDAELPPCSAGRHRRRALRLCGGSTGTKCDVVLVGCGVPKRGMGWYHGKQMLEGDVPSAKMTAVVEPWFLGPGADSPPGETFKKWADEMEAEHGTKFVKDISELEITVRTYPHRHTHLSLSLSG